MSQYSSKDDILIDLLNTKKEKYDIKGALTKHLKEPGERVIDYISDLVYEQKKIQSEIKAL